MLSVRLATNMHELREKRMNYDVIGDVHGEYDLLVALLKKLGYAQKQGVWKQYNHKAIFVGDLVDRGPQEVATVNLVRKMVESGNALCIMGNHELNAIAWFTQVPHEPNIFLRNHNSKNYKQHEAFLHEVEGKNIHKELISWFKTLPLWLNLGDIRIVHACWNEKYMYELQMNLGPSNNQTLTEELLVVSTKENNDKAIKHPAFFAVEALCKGLEASLPNGHYFIDKDQQKRHEIRIKWWQKEFSNYQEAALAPQDIVKNIPDIPFIKDQRLENYRGAPVFFGHYSLQEEPRIFTQKIACLDYLVAGKNTLVAYRWQGETELENENLVVCQ